MFCCAGFQSACWQRRVVAVKHLWLHLPQMLHSFLLEHVTSKHDVEIFSSPVYESADQHRQVLHGWSLSSMYIVQVNHLLTHQVSRLSLPSCCIAWPNGGQSIDDLLQWRTITFTARQTRTFLICCCPPSPAVTVVRQWMLWDKARY